MKINWKARTRNKAFWTGLASMIIGFIYELLSLLGLAPKFDEAEITNIIMMILSILGAIGVIVDPTTKGFSDSDRAMTYLTEEDPRDTVIEPPEEVDESEARG